ncbi:hypothetical protein DPMN_029098 [Dreissena polymorpha]|uniref:Uncharacterized protein n=1 Tax=Dreissena polymorpha TaxID=45954 RepID=A0A9D4LVV3_DREPO|nr:hypothetical protein DPMN_029098 [Dreissena polymorpha]
MSYIPQVVKNEEEEQDFDDEDTEDIKLLPPKMSINLKSADGLQVTMTKACLESLTNLGKVSVVKDHGYIGNLYGVYRKNHGK